MAISLFLVAFKGSSSSDGQRSLFSSILDNTTIDTTAASVIPTSQSKSSNFYVAEPNPGTNDGQESNPKLSFDPSAIQGNSLQANDSTSSDYLDYFKPEQVIQYTVKPDDTVGSIAVDFGVSVNTVLWANNIKNPNSLNVGQTLKIPPVTGILYTVKTGDTVKSIATKYKADSQSILSFNNVSEGQPLDVGSEIMLPGGQLPGPSPVYIAKSVTVGTRVYLPTSDGQCVSFVQVHGYSGLKGNAKDWVRYINTSMPQVGGVVVFVGHGYGFYGHIALITAVKENSIQVVEQNFYGRRIVDHREVSLNDSAIAGFVR